MDEVDRISFLPPNILDHILQFLPLRDAFKTSILSRSWRFKWALLPQLILDSSFQTSLISYIIEFGLNQHFDALLLEYSSTISNILLSHDGPIRKFFINVPSWLANQEEVSRWICFVSRKCVEELTVVRDNDMHRELPPGMFSSVYFNHLTHLKLDNCSLPSISMAFRGFPCLTSLKLLFGVRTTGQANKLGIVVSKCPLLEKLKLEIYEDTDSLTIRAPKLQKLVVNGRLSAILLEETQRIKMFTLNVELDHKRNEMLQFFSHLLLVEKLIVGYNFWENCYRGEELTDDIPSKLRELKNLELNEVYLDSELDVAYLVLFLNMAPNLQNLEIDVAEEQGQPAVSSLTDVGDCCLDQLKCAIIKVDWLSSSHSSALWLIKMVLLSSPVLEVMSVDSIIPECDKFRIAEELLQYCRASSNAKIIFKLHPDPKAG